MTLLGMALIVALLLVAGQTCLKLGLDKTGGISGESLMVFQTWFTVLTNPMVILGFVLYGLASLLWLRVLTAQELSLVYPLISLSYAISLIVGKWLFDDDINITRLAGVSLIVLGAIVVSRS